jgi:hypothetical protein
MPGFTPGEQTGVFDLVDGSLKKVDTVLTKADTTIKQGE